MPQSTQQGLPGVPAVPMVGADGVPTQSWYSFFLNLWQRTGGASGSAGGILDQITNVVGSMLYRATSGWIGLSPSAQYRVLRMGTQVPEWDVLDGNSFGVQSQNEVFASPNGSNGIPTFRALTANDFSFGSQPANEFFASPNGSSGAPSFRAIATADLDGTAGQYPGTATNDNASAGNIGEYVSSTSSSTSLSSTTPTNLTSISLSAGDWDVWGSVSLAIASASGFFSAWTSKTSATDPLAPNNGSYAEFDLVAFDNKQTASLGIQRISVPAGPNQTVYVGVKSTFSGSLASVAAVGFIAARRVR